VAKRPRVAALLCVVALQCNKYDRAAPDPTSIYRDFLADLVRKPYFAGSNPPARFVVAARTMTGKRSGVLGFAMGFEPELPKLRNDTRSDFWRQSRSRATVRLSTVGGKKVHLLTEAELARIFSEDADPDAGWKSFHAQFPDSAGLMSLSRIGLSKDRRQALVFISVGSWSLAGYGAYYLLAREPTGWTITAEQVVWVS
jgi:hypothetical protein